MKHVSTVSADFESSHFKWHFCRIQGTFNILRVVTLSILIVLKLNEISMVELASLLCC